MRRVTLVCGPPCAGKTTYVRQHAQPGDLIADQDRLGPTAMRRALSQIARMTTGTAWVIRCCPGPQRRDQLARSIRATDMVLINPGRAELLARANGRPDPGRQVATILRWYADEDTDRTPGTRTTSTTQKTTTERGLGWTHQQERKRQLATLRPGTPCPRCHLPMHRAQLLDLDDFPGRVFGGPQTKRLAHRRCNRSAGATLGNRLRAARAQPQRAITSRRW